MFPARVLQSEKHMYAQLHKRTVKCALAYLLFIAVIQLLIVLINRSGQQLVPIYNAHVGAML